MFSHPRLSLFAFLAAPLISATHAADPAPFSIPQVDISWDKTRQVVVDREAGQYLGHPTTVLLEDGRTMIIVYPKGHGRGGIVMKRSTDAGLTWSERLAVPESWATSLEVPTIYRTIDKSGKKRLIMFSGLYPIRQAVSEDDGATWSELQPIGDYGGIVACASCGRLKNGDYMALFHDDGRFLTKEGRAKGAPPKFVVYKIVSSDGGLTWSKPEPIAEHAAAHLCEPGMVRSPDGKQLAVLLRENSRKLQSFVIFSDDEGQTWSKPCEVRPALTGDRHTAKYSPDGRLFITFRDTCKGSPTAGDWVAWVGTYDDIVQGREGEFRIRLMDNTKGADCAYPPVEVLPDGTIVTTTYGHWTKDEMPYIVSVRLKLAEFKVAPNGKEVLMSCVGEECKTPPRGAVADGTTIELVVKIDTAGNVTSARVTKSSGESLLDTAAIEMAKNMKHKPLIKNGLAIEQEIVVPFTFNNSPSAAISGSAANAGFSLQWIRLPDLNDARGFGGQFAGVSNGRLLLYGGTNFPDKPVWEGGAKGWYRDVFVLDSPESEWRKVGKLDDSRPVGYGVSLSTPEGILCIGGADAVRHYTSAFLLNYDGEKLTTRDLPALPRPCAYCSGALIGSTVYVAGGIDKPDAVAGMRTFWSLDLKNLDAGWEEWPAWPSRGRMLAITAAHGESFYLSGGCDLALGPDGKPMRLYLNDTLRYSPTDGWERLGPAPTGIVAAPVPAMTIGDEIVVFGGDDGSHLGFKPPDKHPGFPKNTYALDVRTNQWRRIGAPEFVPVATPVVPWGGGFVVVSGEIRPAVRSREVWFVKPK